MPISSVVEIGHRARRRAAGCLHKPDRVDLLNPLNWRCRRIVTAWASLITDGPRRTAGGGILQILAIDRDVKLPVLELNQDRTPLDVVAPARQYAAWARTPSCDQVDGIALGYHGAVALRES